MRVVIVGLGIQGKKRKAIAGEDVVACVDVAASGVEYKTIADVPLDSYDAALVCTPDQAKLEILRYLLANRKHVLVEKPLFASAEADLRELHELSRLHQATCYTAYNHRFEPHLVRMKETLDSGVLGNVYLARIFYGNGTARDVRNSVWRDEGLGVLSDIGSHLLDLMMFFFGRLDEKFEIWSYDSFENRACDHVLFGARGKPVLELEATLLSWRNTFTLDVFGEQGSAHVDCLCKWGPSVFRIRTRVLPSGRPHEEVQTIEGADPTWAIEYQYFKELCRTAGTNLENDISINSVLNDLSVAASREVGRA